MSGRADDFWVDDDAGPGGDGCSAETAYDTIDEALAMADVTTGADTIFVARGVYVPAMFDNDALSVTFRIPSNVTLIGGLDGYLQDEMETTETILDGQLAAKHVVLVRNNPERVILQSIVVTGGRANGVEGAAPLISAHEGAGIWTNSDLTLLTCTIRDNGAVPPREGSPVGQGGGLFVVPTAGTPPGPNPRVRVINCSFYGNSARGSGGAASTSSSTSFVNCVFYENSADATSFAFNSNRGGAIAGSAVIVNCTFADNTADDGGGALYVPFSGGALIQNSVVWNNSPPQLDEAIEDSIIQNANTDSVNPQFVNPGNDDYGLLFDSPAKNSGDNALLDADTEDIDGDGNEATETRPDLLLLPRAADGQVGQGAFEYCPYDLSGDGRVSFADLTDLLNAWGCCCEECPDNPCAAPPPCFADFVGDGIVGWGDLTVLLANYHDPENPSDGCPGFVPAGQGAMAGSGMSPAFADENALSIGAIAAATANGQLTPQQGAEAIATLLALSAAP